MTEPTEPTRPTQPTELTDPSLLRVEKGECAPEELAAVTALLLARAAVPPAGAGRRSRSRAPWHRLEPTSGFRAPHSWRHR
ncbi:acyl-CoA carboxylase epsilon subunit [Streptomyces qinzhouensis]|uniref:Acyl-CoA carboxylase subunit epsilon n=1 Tax=Streptomyces qinzhouensis TaxID=2599401 RepID=A0A5B8JD70_9ACTN|nr:acyl-CoA carboxylase epsilon subunit [Streptomyces qinzhouensis]QDY79447.1 acyl-CoA carboxylase subunit epsilon [Streptomyces qinzhouensis]